MREHPAEATVKFPSQLDIRNPVKTPPASKSLPGVLEDMEIPDKSGDGV